MVLAWFGGAAIVRLTGAAPVMLVLAAAFVLLVAASMAVVAAARFAGAEGGVMSWKGSAVTFGESPPPTVMARLGASGVLTDT